MMQFKSKTMQCFLDLFIFYTATILNLLILAPGLWCEDVGDLCFACVVFRHGDRAPEGSYPTDPYGEMFYWPNGWGQLTELGQFQQVELGRWFRDRYRGFLSHRYVPSEIYARSTDVDRTLMSAYCNLAGLYECSKGGGNESLPWQPVPVHTVPVETDHVLAARKTCPMYDRLFHNLMTSREICEINEYYEDIYLNLSRNSGLKIETARDCLFLYSVINIQNLHGYQLPDWTKSYFPQPLTEIAEFAFKLPCFTTHLKRLKCGSLLKDIIQHMEDKKTGKITQKMWMYSAHDTTLANLMQCLNVFDGLIPPYTATIIIELFKISHQYYVMVSYKTPTTLKVLRLPSCDRICPFECFKSILSPVLPDNWENECRIIPN